MITLTYCSDDRPVRGRRTCWGDTAAGGRRTNTYIAKPSVRAGLGRKTDQRREAIQGLLARILGPRR